MPTPQNKHNVRNHNMNVNSNPTTSQQNKKKFLSQIFSHIYAGAIDIGDRPLFLNISLNFCQNLKRDTQDEGPGEN
jgi:hypothetical protein